MKVTGPLTKRKVKENSFIMTVTFMKEIGLIVKLTVRGFTPTKRERTMRANGKTINNMAEE